MKSRLTSLLLLGSALFLGACAQAAEDTIVTAESSVEKQDDSIMESQTPAESAQPNDETDTGDANPAGSSGDSAGGASQPQNQSFAGKVPAPDFPGGLDWFNTTRPLTLGDLQGKVVVLDFWTYGCINCLHVIPELKALEEKYTDELVVIGVHSAKFENEGESENIERIIQRYELKHPVVNDREFQVWSQYGARAWPTLVIIDPQGQVLGYHAGEGIYEPFDYIIGNIISEFDEKGLIERKPLSAIVDDERRADSPLLFPGKVLADAANDRLYIADSNHNRIVVTDLQGMVLEVVGDGQPRLRDGNFQSASFFRPQGLTLDDQNNLYVADTENHAIRLINFDQRSVNTVAGTGEQAYLTGTEVDPESSPLNSPWDVLFHDGLVYIAMAGQHQVWVLDPSLQKLTVYAGSGREELRDGTLQQGGLNQPSGLSSDGELLYIADSEASAIRAAGLMEGGRLATIVGTGLFDFGDVDGRGSDVRLQHPLGVVYDDGHLYVADTYNSKIKIIDPESRESSTFLGGAEAGWADGFDALFDEPGGISSGGGKLYIADTNNHVVRVADIATGEVETLVLIDAEGLLTRQLPGEEYTGNTIYQERQFVARGPGIVTLDIELPEGYKLNDLAPFSMEWLAPGGGISFGDSDPNRSIINPDFPLSIPVEFAGGETDLTLELVIYYCEEEAQSLCLIERARIHAPITAGGEGNAELRVSYKIDQPPA